MNHGLRVKEIYAKLCPIKIFLIEVKFNDTISVKVIKRAF